MRRGTDGRNGWTDGGAKTAVLAARSAGQGIGEDQDEGEACCLALGKKLTEEESEPNMANVLGKSWES